MNHIITRSGISAEINGKTVSKIELDQWKKERVKEVCKKLDIPQIPDGHADEMVDQLAEEKLKFSHDEIEKKLHRELMKCNRTTKMAVFFSGKKRKYTDVVMHIPGVSAEHAMAEYEKTQLINSPEHLSVNMRACPDHYYLGASTPTDLEVIETCGNNATPSQFFIKYGELNGLTKSRDTDTACESAGIAVLPGGKMEGGVRHQFKNTKEGCTAYLCVEFPGIMPDELIYQHEMHVVCEFSYWMQWVLDTHPQEDWKAV